MLAATIAVMLYLTLIHVCGRFTANYAVQRGRSRGGWFVLGGPVLSRPVHCPGAFAAPRQGYGGRAVDLA